MAAFIESIAKQRERNVEWAVKAVREAVAVADDEALELGVIDLVASSREELFEKVDGRSVDVAGEERPLRVAGAVVRERKMSWANRFLDVLATWGPCVESCCLSDFDMDDEVGITDFLIVLANWS